MVLAHLSLCQIDLTHNDVKQCFCGSNVHCGSYSHARIQYSVVFPLAENLNADMCSDMAGPSSSGSGDLFELSDRSNTMHRYSDFLPLLALLDTILDLTVTITTILSFGACYVIMHKVYW